MIEELSVFVDAHGNFGHEQGTGESELQLATNVVTYPLLVEAREIGRKRRDDDVGHSPPGPRLERPSGEAFHPLAERHAARISRMAARP